MQMPLLCLHCGYVVFQTEESGMSRKCLSGQQCRQAIIHLAVVCCVWDCNLALTQPKKNSTPTRVFSVLCPSVSYAHFPQHEHGGGRHHTT
jgi:hypothetical protein